MTNPELITLAMNNMIDAYHSWVEDEDAVTEVKACWDAITRVCDTTSEDPDPLVQSLRKVADGLGDIISDNTL